MSKGTEKTPLNSAITGQRLQKTRKINELGQALDLAAGYLNKGELSRARQMCQQIREAWPQHPAAANILGVIAFQVGENTAAAGYFHTAITLNAEYVDAHYNLGNALRALGQFERAIDHYGIALKLEPDHLNARYNLANSYKAIGKLKQALIHFEGVIELSPGHPDAHNNAGNTLKALGRLRDALPHYEKAIESHPEYAAAHYNLGTTLQSLGRHGDAIPHYQRALQIQPDLAAAHGNLGTAFRALGRLEEAINHYGEAISLQPGFVVAGNNLAALYERTNQLDLAEASNVKALSVAPDNPDGLFIQALLQRRRGNLEDALSGFQTLDGQKLSENYAQRRWFEVGKLLDAKGESDAAFEAFSQGNSLHAGRLDTAEVNAKRYRSRIEQVSSLLKSEWADSADGAVDGNSSPVFLVGFPRSGTTLLDQILDSHPRVQVMEEKRAFSAVEAAISRTAGNYPQSISNLDKAQLKELRSIYFETVDAQFCRNAELLLVDKFPLNIEYLPLIQRLFPDAHIVFSARHPCDVILSNFMQYYELNDAMANFFTLEDTVQFYQQVMGLWLQCAERLPLNIHWLRYESMVTDFDATARELFKFLEVDWDDTVADFHQHASSRNIINTPSYEQVTQPLYTSAMGRWQRYGEHFAPYLDELAPIIEKLGYPAPH